MDSGTADSPTIRPARDTDLAMVVELIEPFVRQRKLLPRDANDLRLLLPNAFIAEWQGRVVGFVALEVYSPKLAELLCLAVAADVQGQGVGRRLVDACIERARDRNVREVMAITSSESFLQSCGFDFTLPDERKALFLRP